MCDCNTVLVDSLIPKVATVERITEETSDVKSFIVTLDGSEPFTYRSGQCAMLSVMGVGEAMISITSSPTQKGYLEFAIKKAGEVTGILHSISPGQQIGVRGPYGNSFPMESFEGKDLVFIGGGIGLAPLRSVIANVLDNRDRYGRVDIIYGARSAADLVFKTDLFETWPTQPNCHVHVTVDRGDESWTGNVGFVPSFLEQVNPSPVGAVAITCGPPIMIKFVLAALDKMGYTDDQVVTTLEMKMKCGIGKCGRCNIGDKYVCIDGPVFTRAQLKELPPEF